MAWWGAVIEGFVPAAVAAGALLFQSHRTERREDRRRKEDAGERDKERQHALQLADVARRQSVTDAWREDRKKAHAEAFAALVDYRRTFYVLNLQITPEMLKAQARSRAAVSVVKLYAGDAAASWAASAHTKLVEIQAAIGLVGGALDGAAGLLQEASTEIEFYVGWARRELETNG